MSRVLIAGSLLLVSAVVASAGPIQWGYRVVDATTGELREERSGITDPRVSIQAVRRPEASFETPEASNSSRVTIIDERTGLREEIGVSWWVAQQWDLRLNDAGEQYWDWTSEYEGQTRIVPGYGWRPTGGQNHYTIRAEDGGVWVEVEALPTVTTPEPGTLLIGGIALAGGVGAWVRRRRA